MNRIVGIGNYGLGQENQAQCPSQRVKFWEGFAYGALGGLVVAFFGTLALQVWQEERLRKYGRL